MKVHTLTYNSFQVNTYLVEDGKGNCLIIDPAFYSTEEQEHFESTLEQLRLRPVGMVNTHCHVDHMLGVNYLKNKKGFVLQAHREEANIEANTPLMAELFGWKIEATGGIDIFVEDGALIKLGDYHLRALFVPGHSPGSLAFFSSDGNFVITGDVLFQGSIGRTDLPGGDYDTLMDSISQRLLVLPAETLVYPGHGPFTTIGKEALENPFLKSL